MEKYKFLGPNKSIIKSSNKSCIAFILRYKKVYLGKGIKGFDKIIQQNPKLKNQLEKSGRDSILKYAGLIFPNINTVILNNFPSKPVFNKYITLLDKELSRKRNIDGMEFESPFIRKNKDDWLIKIGKMRYIPLSKYRQVKEENVILNSQEKEESDIKKTMTQDGDIVLVPSSPEIRDEVKSHIKNQIENNSEKLSYRTVFGRKYIVGIDEDENVTVYDWDGNNYELDTFYGVVKDRRKHEQKLNNINKIDLYLDFIDKEPENFVDDLAEARQDEIETKLLTDRDDIQKKLTRSYPVLEYKGRQLIVDGRFKGYYLDEMINMAGRQIAGTGYYLDDNNIPRPMEKKDSSYDENTITTKYEPYVTYDEDSNRMVVVLPDNDSRTKSVLNDIAKNYRGVDRKSKNTFMFSPMLYEIIQRDVKGFVMSEKAMEVVKSTINRERNKIKKNLHKQYDHISTSNIEGMKTEFPDGTPIEFMAHQKKAIDKVLKDGNGFVGLDTGTGKCVLPNTQVSININNATYIDDISNIWEMYNKNPDNIKNISNTEKFIYLNNSTVGSFNETTKEFELDDVVGIYKQKINENVVNVEFKNGMFLNSTMNHKYAVLKDGIIKFKKAIDLKENDVIINKYNNEIQPNKNLSFMTEGYVRVLAYIISEGYSKKQPNHGGNCIYITQKDKNNLYSLIENIQNSLWENLTSSYNIKKDDKYPVLRMYGNKMHDWHIQRNFDLNNLSKDKDIPNYIITASKDMQIVFLRAFFEAEASVEKGGIHLTSASYKIINKLQIMLNNLGILSRYKKVYKSATNGYNIKRKYYLLTISSTSGRKFRDVIGFESDRKQNKLFNLYNNMPENPNLNIFDLSSVFKIFYSIIKDKISLKYFKIHREYLKSKSVSKIRLQQIISQIEKLYNDEIISELKDELLIKKPKYSPRNNNIKRTLDKLNEINKDDIFYILNTLKFILNNDIELLHIKSINHKIYDGYVYDLSVKNNHNYVLANGILVHNTMVAIGTMMQWISDGTLSKNGKNGKCLFVGDASLRGNFPSQIKKHVEDYQTIKSYFDVISYYEFKEDPERWKKYGCIIFDEAQSMRNNRSKVHKVAKELDHPHKILMTASVLEKSALDLYNLIAIKNNAYIEDTKVADKKRRDFINAFCEKVGNKVIGLKDDQTTKRMFRRWVRNETLYIDKEDIKEVDLPPITPPEERTVSVEMPDEMKSKYKEMSEPIKDTLARMLQKYKENKLSKTEINQELSRVMGSLQKLTTFLALPEDELGEEFPNPKISYAIDYLNSKLSTNDTFKLVTFTDKPDLAVKMGINASKDIRGKLHVVGLAEGIDIYKNGELIEKIRRSNLKKYKDSDGNELTLGNYQVELLKQYQSMYNVCTLNLTKAYTKGHNLQNCDAVLHLDRDTWNNENMEQRDARVWRTGREKEVDVKIVDMVNDAGTSLDEIQKYSMEIERKLFEDLIDKSFDEEYIMQDEDYIKIQDIKSLIKNKEAYYYQLNSNVKYSSKIKNK